MRKKLIILIWIILYIFLLILIFLYKTRKDTILVFSNTNNKSTIVYDVQNDKILYEENIHQKMLPASLTKVLTALTVYKNIDLNKTILIDNEILKAVGSRMYLEVGDVITVKELLYGLILQSGNDAALALQYAYSDNPNDFIIKMNEEVKKLNLKNTLFNNSSGLDEDSYNYTTTYDFAKITAATINIPFLKELLGTKHYQIKLDDKTLSFRHKHKLVITNPNFIGGKTGYTKKAGRTLVSIYQGQNTKLIIITFNDPNDWKTHTYLGNKFG